jgi:hypothetical protein
MVQEFEILVFLCQFPTSVSRVCYSDIFMLYIGEYKKTIQVQVPMDVKKYFYG